MFKPLWNAPILGDRLTIEGVGEWTFDDDRVVFFDSDCNMTDFELPNGFHQHAVSIYSGAACTLGVVQKSEVLWHFRRNGEIAPAYRIAGRFECLDRVEAYGEQMVYSCEIGVCVFRNDQRVWSHEFRDGGLRYETLETTPIGIRYESAAGEPQAYRWSDGARVA